MSLAFDADGRAVQADSSGVTQYYAYAADNKRIYRRKTVYPAQIVAEEIYFYSPHGQKLAQLGRR